VRSGLVPAHPERFSIPGEISLVALCGALAGFGALSPISCMGENQDRIARVCYSPGAQTAYEAVMIAATAIALIAVIASHIRDRRRIAQLGCLLSVALVAAAFIWAFETGSRSAYPPPSYQGASPASRTT